jgi:hypothetical protein
MGQALRHLPEEEYGDHHPAKGKIGEHTQASRWVRFTSSAEILALQPTLRRYIDEASTAEGGVRSLNAGTQKVVHLSCRGREAAKDPGRAGGEVCANDLERPRVQRVHRLTGLPLI